MILWTGHFYKQSGVSRCVHPNNWHYKSFIFSHYCLIWRNWSNVRCMHMIAKGSSINGSLRTKKWRERLREFVPRFYTFYLEMLLLHTNKATLMLRILIVPYLIWCDMYVFMFANLGLMSVRSLFYTRFHCSQTSTAVFLKTNVYKMWKGVSRANWAQHQWWNFTMWQQNNYKMKPVIYPYNFEKHWSKKRFSFLPAKHCYT